MSGSVFFFHILHFYIFQCLTLQTVTHPLDYFKVLFVLCTTYIKYNFFSSFSKQLYKYLPIYLRKENSSRTSLLCFKTTPKTFYSSYWNRTRLTIHLKSTDFFTKLLFSTRSALDSVLVRYSVTFLCEEL